MKDRRQNPVRCPRCGYDLRGVVAAWEERCPLEGVCSECGLGVCWAEVLRPEKFEPGWCVEFVSERRAFPAACVKTFACCCQPWLFWRRLKMSQPIHGRRLAVYILLLFVSVYVLFALSQGVRAWDSWWRMQNDPDLTFSSVDGYTVFVHAASLPFSDSPPGMMTLVYPLAAGGRRAVTFGYNRPLDLARYWSNAQPLSLFVATVFMMCPLVFVLLPASRKRAKVRWAHVGRVTAYGMSYMALGAIVVLVAGTGHLVELSPTWLERWLMVLERLALPAVCVGLLVWWGVAIHRYLRMEHALGVTLAVGLTAILAAAALLFVVDPSFVIVPLSRLLFPRLLFPT